MSITNKIPTKKVIWYISYNGPSITSDVLHTKTKLVVDECYTSHGIQTNTLLHLSKRVYKTTVVKALHTSGVLVIKIFGMDKLCKNLRKNPLIDRLYQDFDNSTPTFESWVASTRSPSKVLLRDKDDACVRKLTTNSRMRLAKSLVAENEQVDVLQRMVNELDSKLADAQSSNDELKSKYADAQRVIDTLKEELLIARTGK